MFQLKSRTDHHIGFVAFPLNSIITRTLSTNKKGSKSLVSMTSSNGHSSSDNQLGKHSSNTGKSPSEFVILGSGVSTGIPRISCIIRPNQGRYCHVCHDAINTPKSKNRRCNVSALVRSNGKTILIDCGKTIREASMNHFPQLGVENVDAIVLTHGHADAVLGLDDARDIQMGWRPKIVDNQIVEWSPPFPTPVFLNEETMAVCERAFPYLMPPKDDGGEKDIKRRVAAIDWHPYSEEKYFTPFYPLPNIPIQITPIPMFHGGDYICMGFVITISQLFDSPSSPSNTIVYLSDLNKLPDRTLTYLKQLERIDLLVVDLLTESNVNLAHFSRGDAIECVRALRPKQAVAVGMTCSLGLHDDVNASLAEELKGEGVSLRLAYDGERFPCTFS